MPKILPEMGFQKEEIPFVKFDTPLCGALLSYCRAPAQWGCGCAGYAHRVPTLTPRLMETLEVRFQY